MSAEDDGRRSPNVVQLHEGRTRRFFRDLQRNPFVTIVLDEATGACKIYTQDVSMAELRKMIPVIESVAEKEGPDGSQ